MPLLTRDGHAILWFGPFRFLVAFPKPLNSTPKSSEHLVTKANALTISIVQITDLPEHQRFVQLLYSRLIRRPQDVFSQLRKIGQHN